MADEQGAQQACSSTLPSKSSGTIIASFFNGYSLLFNGYCHNPLAFQIRSFALLISWNFFSAALRTSSPKAATLSG